MRRTLVTCCLYTLISAVMLGIGYPLLIAGIAHSAFPAEANGGMISVDGNIVGSRVIGQAFGGAGYFHSRPSAAGVGYDASLSSGSNLAPSNKALIDRIAANVSAERTDSAVPIDLVTTSASGLDPDITPAAALYQVPRVARERHVAEDDVRSIVLKHIIPRQFGLLGEPRVNVLELNLALIHREQQ